MIQRPSKQQGSLNDHTPDLTPMLDILFILLVFFMLTAGAVYQSLDLTLPSSVAEELSTLDAPKHIMLEIHDNHYAIDGQKQAAFDDLKTALPVVLTKRPNHELIIAGDKDISMQRLLTVLTYLQSQNIQAANILMKGHTTP